MTALMLYEDHIDGDFKKHQASGQPKGAQDDGCTPTRVPRTLRAA
jgi:hypothetical protein